MNDIQQSVDELRFVLQGDGESFLAGTEPSDEFKQLVSAYAPLCKECNRRLRKCDEALKQGLRSEALHLADAAPNLLDLVAILDFPERELLNEVCSAHALPKPDPLMLDVASALNEAYALQEPLSALLDQHRLLALARSPLPQRLSVLRSLADSDPESPHWDVDLREMERARFAEIETTCRLATARGDVGVLKLLLGELNSTSWRETPPQNLIRELKVRGGQVVRTGARQKLESLVPQLHDAMSSLNLAIARELREQWQEAIKSAQLPKNDEVAEQVAPVLDWLNDEDRKESQEQAFRQAISALERGLDDDELTLVELQRLGAEVEKQERAVADGLADRYLNRLESLKVYESRKHRLIIFAITISVILIGGLVAIAVSASNNARESAQILAAIKGFVSEGNLTEARRMLDENRARAVSEEWLTLEKELIDAEQKESDRQLKLESLLKAIASAEDSDRALALTEQARELAVTTSEKIELGKQEDHWRSRKSNEIKTREQGFRGLLQSVAASLQKLDQLLQSDSTDTEIVSLLSQVMQEVAELKLAREDVTKELGSQAELLESRLIALRKAHDNNKRRSQLLDKLAYASFIPVLDATSQNKVDLYFETLREFVAAFPSDPLASAFNAAAENEALKHVAAKTQLVDRWKGEFWPSDSDHLERRLQDCKQFLSTNTQSPDLEDIKQYEAVLKSVRRREFGDDVSDVSIKERFSTMFSASLVSQGHMIRCRNGDRIKSYYLPESRDFSTLTANAKIDVIVGYEGEKRKQTIVPTEILFPKATGSPPQAELAMRAAREIPKLSIGKWGDYHQDLILELMDSTAVDPVLRYYLIVRTMKYAGLGNALLEPYLAEALKTLNENKVDLSVSWMDPDDSAAENTRGQVKSLLFDLKPDDVRAVWQQSMEAETGLSEILFRTLMPVGYLERTRAGTWNLRSEWKADRNYRLYCASAASDAGTIGPMVWRQIGRKSDKDSSINFPKDLGLTEGLVVFAAPELLRPAPKK